MSLWGLFHTGGRDNDCEESIKSGEKWDRTERKLTSEQRGDEKEVK